MSVAKYYPGQIVYFTHEYMIAEMLPTGHHEKTEYIDLSGTIKESYLCANRWEYLVDPIDESGEIDYEITLDELEIDDVECNEQLLDRQVDELVAL